MSNGMTDRMSADILAMTPDDAWDTYVGSGSTITWCTADVSRHVAESPMCADLDDDARSELLEKLLKCIPRTRTGALLRAAREAAYLTRRECAAAARVHAWTWRMWEGRAGPVPEEAWDALRTLQNAPPQPRARGGSRPGAGRPRTRQEREPGPRGRPRTRPDGARNVQVVLSPAAAEAWSSHEGDRSAWVSRLIEDATRRAP